MTPDEINLMIAEWEGWTNVKQSRMYQGRVDPLVMRFFKEMT